MPNTYQLVTNMHDPAGNYVANVFHYSLSEGGSASPFEYAQALVAKWLTSVSLDFLKLLGNDTLLDFVTAKRVSGTGGPTASTIVTSTGTGAGSSLMSGAAADLQWQTASSNNRPGHTYVAPIPDGSYTAGSWVAPFTTNVGTFITTLKTQLTLTGSLGTADFGVYTRKTKVFNICKEGQLRPKPTMLNKRTLPII
jgi:hypothetical protein